MPKEHPLEPLLRQVTDLQKRLEKLERLAHGTQLNRTPSPSITTSVNTASVVKTLSDLGLPPGSLGAYFRVTVVTDAASVVTISGAGGWAIVLHVPGSPGEQEAYGIVMADGEEITIATDYSTNITIGVEPLLYLS